MLVAHGSTINKVKELAGKKIAVAGHDDIATLLIDSLLTENNVPLHDVQIEPGFALPAIPALLNKHVIDAGPVPEPFVSEGQESLGVQSLADLDQGATLNFPIQGFAVDAVVGAAEPRIPSRPSWPRWPRGRRSPTPTAMRSSWRPRSSSACPPMTAAVMALPNFPLSVDPQQLQRVVDGMVQFGFVPASDSSFKISSMTG